MICGDLDTVRLWCRTQRASRVLWQMPACRRRSGPATTPLRVWLPIPQGPNDLQNRLIVHIGSFYKLGVPFWSPSVRGPSTWVKMKSLLSLETPMYLSGNL